MPKQSASSDEPKRQYEVYGELVEVDDGEGGTTTIERAYDEPRVVDELAPGQRGNLLSEE